MPPEGPAAKPAGCGTTHLQERQQPMQILTALLQPGVAWLGLTEDLLPSLL